MSLTTLQSSSNEITFLEQKPVELEASHWQNTANRRRGEINDLIPDSYKISPTFLKGSNHVNLVETCGVLNSRELSILKLSATKLLELIHNQTFTSVEVATAFCKSAAIAHQAVKPSQQFSGFANLNLDQLPCLGFVQTVLGRCC